MAFSPAADTIPLKPGSDESRRPHVVARPGLIQRGRDGIRLAATTDDKIFRYARRLRRQQRYYCRWRGKCRKTSSQPETVLTRHKLVSADAFSIIVKYGLHRRNVMEITRRKK